MKQLSDNCLQQKNQNNCYNLKDMNPFHFYPR